ATTPAKWWLSWLRADGLPGLPGEVRNDVYWSQELGRQMTEGAGECRRQAQSSGRVTHRMPFGWLVSVQRLS
ncbi:hypothetical protein BaRGS_00024653, partial [Batillaria attramentaria]